MNSHRARKRERRQSFDVFRFLAQVKLIAIELAATIVFFFWLYHAVMHEIGR